MPEPNDNPGVIAPPPLIYLGCVAAGYVIDSFVPWSTIFSPAQKWVGIGMIGTGFLLSGWSVIEFIRHGTHPDPRHATTAIIRTGPFRLSRNPIYVAFTLMHIGVALWTVKPWILVSVLPALMLIRAGVIAREERYLEQKFGQEYEDYRDSVRRWL